MSPIDDPLPSPRSERSVERQAVRPEDQFRSFVGNSIGFVGTLAASIPMLTDYAKVIKAPPLPGVPDALGPVLATFICGVVFLGCFWLRDTFARPIWVLCGFLGVFAGAGSLVFSQTAGPADLKFVAFGLGFPVAIGGAALVFLYGFVRYAERAAILQSILPRLESTQWSALLSFAQTQVAVRNSLESPSRLPRVREALKRSAEDIVVEYNEMLSRLRSGLLEIRGPRMDDLFENFAEAVEGQFRALSRDDLDYWTSRDCEHYLETNRRLLARGRRIERVFLLREEPLTPDHRAAMERQLEMGVQLRLALLVNTRDIVDDDRELDFGIFDDFAVSFWRFSSGRVFRISTSRGDCKRFAELYRQVLKVCQAVPGKDGTERSLVVSADELRQALAALGL